MSPAAPPRNERFAIADEIDRLYRVAYGRPADPDGLASFSARRRAGTSLADLAAEFVTSSEFIDKAAGRDPIVVLCGNALGRAPGPDLGAATPAAAAASLVENPEVIARLGPEIAIGRSDPAARLRVKAEIDRLYRVVYGRAADPEGLDAFADQIVGGRALVTLAAECLRSSEFADRAEGRSPNAVLWANAGKASTVAPEPAMPPDVLATTLVRDPDVIRRLPVLASLFPAGVPLDDPWAYRFWLEETQRPPIPAIARPDSPPGLSILVVLDTPEAEALDAMVVSVRAQSAAEIELVLVSAQPLAPAIAELIERHTAADPRVRLCRPRAWPFQAPIQGALKQCRGTFVSCLDQHDRLDAVAAATLAASADDADVVLADADRFDGDGERWQPHLTACWDPDSALAAPPTGLVAIRASRLAALRLKQRIGPDHVGWDLLLQATADLPRDRVRHLPAVLLSRARPETPPRPGDFTRLADAHLRATRQAGSMAEWDAEAAAVRIRRPLATTPLVSVIIPTRDRADLLHACLDGLLRRTDYPHLEILVVDNESREPATHRLFADLGGDGRVRVLPVPGEFNWSRLNNLAVREMRGEVALLLNNDTEVVDPGWLREMTSQALRPEIGAVGAKLLYPDGRIQHAGVVLGPNGSATHAWRYADGASAGYMGQLRRVRRVSAVTGACLALRRSVFQEVGGLDQADLQVAWNDVDLCLKITAAGYDVLWTPYTTMTHIEQASRGSDERPAAKRRLYREQDHMRERWGTRVDEDPYFSPLLALSEDGVRLSVRG